MQADIAQGQSELAALRELLAAERVTKEAAASRANVLEQQLESVKTDAAQAISVLKAEHRLRVEALQAPRASDEAAIAAWRVDLDNVREESTAAVKARQLDRESDATHTGIQGWFRDLGLDLEFDVWIAANDRSRVYAGGCLSDRCLKALPEHYSSGADSIRLIDVIWIGREHGQVIAAFEVEHSTSIYSGMVRMLDLALGDKLGSGSSLFLVAPDNRKQDVQKQLSRPTFSRVSDLGFRYLPYSELRSHRAAIAGFGSGLKPLLEISQSL